MAFTTDKIFFFILSTLRTLWWVIGSLCFPLKMIVSSFFSGWIVLWVVTIVSLSSYPWRLANFVLTPVKWWTTTRIDNTIIIKIGWGQCICSRKGIALALLLVTFFLHNVCTFHLHPIIFFNTLIFLTPITSAVLH